MLARWTELLPVFVVRWMAIKLCERVIVFRKTHERVVAVARPGVYFLVPASTDSGEG